jgi:hypothetical protein
VLPVFEPLTVLAFPFFHTDLQPFIWSNFKVIPNYTYRIDLRQSLESIKATEEFVVKLDKVFGKISEGLEERKEGATDKASLGSLTLEKKFTKGTRVSLVRMNDPYSTLKAGDKGTVIMVDDIGTIHVKWDNGSCLGVVFGEDSCRKITE